MIRGGQTSGHVNTHTGALLKPSPQDYTRLRYQRAAARRRRTVEIIPRGRTGGEADQICRFCR